MEWRRATILVTVVAAVEFVLLAGAAVALLGNPLADHLRAEAAAAAAPPVRRPDVPSHKNAALARNEVSVIVLNSGGRTGAAAAAADRVRARGYMVASVGNATHAEPTQSVVMYRAGYDREAKRFARDMQIRLVTPLDGMRPADLLGAHLVLIVG